MLKKKSIKMDVVIIFLLKMDRNFGNLIFFNFLLIFFEWCFFWLCFFNYFVNFVKINMLNICWWVIVKLVFFVNFCVIFIVKFEVIV